ncbi:TfuA-like protein [Micromonospora sp. DT228]|uniref:TfuA-like protein n=1 Tax=Micromonospora sp. DT228 TaxID=3393443 RepID=UPI003CEAAE90
MVIVDGYYHQVPSLRHKEILWMLARSVRVVGCSSFGALRAAELWPYGMVGNGTVFEMYRDGVVDADDEVAVAHGEGPEYRKFSVPMVSIRHAVAMARRGGVVTAPEAADVVAVCRGLHYTARSWRAIEALAQGDAGRVAAIHRIRAFLADHPEHADVKAADALDTLRRLGELGCGVSVTARGWVGSPWWQNRLLHEWRAEFSGSQIDGIHIGDAAVMRFQQIYDRDFPRRWSRFVLRAIRDGVALRPGDYANEEIEDDVVAISAGAGITEGSLSAEQRAEWLTPREVSELNPSATVVRMLVRSYRSPRGLFDLVAAERDLVDDAATRTAVAESSVFNAEIARWAPRQGVEHLRADTLRDHLGSVWGADDETSLLAAARDRGFGSLSEAVEAVRPFFLRHHLANQEPVAESRDADN